MIIMAFTGDLFPTPNADGTEPQMSEPISLIIGFSAIFYMVLMAACIIPYLALTIRRLHDQDLSGGWIALPILFGIVLPVFDLDIPIFNFGIVIGLIIVCARRGTRGPNRFGPDPCREPAETID